MDLCTAEERAVRQPRARPSRDRSARTVRSWLPVRSPAGSRAARAMAAAARLRSTGTATRIFIRSLSLGGYIGLFASLISFRCRRDDIFAAVDADAAVRCADGTPDGTREPRGRRLRRRRGGDEARKRVTGLRSGGSQARWPPARAPGQLPPTGTACSMPPRDGGGCPSRRSTPGLCFTLPTVDRILPLVLATRIIKHDSLSRRGIDGGGSSR